MVHAGSNPAARTTCCRSSTGGAAHSYRAGCRFDSCRQHHPQHRRPYGTSHPPRRRTLLSSQCVNAGSGSRPKPTSSAATAWSEARKELIEKLGRGDLCPCGSGLVFRACCLRSGRYEGANRHYYFQGLNTAPPPGGAHPCVAERPRLQPSKLIRRVRLPPHGPSHLTERRSPLTKCRQSPSADSPQGRREERRVGTGACPRCLLDMSA